MQGQYLIDHTVRDINTALLHVDWKVPFTMKVLGELLTIDLTIINSPQRLVRIDYAKE